MHTEGKGTLLKTCKDCVLCLQACLFTANEMNEYVKLGNDCVLRLRGVQALPRSSRRQNKPRFCLIPFVHSFPFPFFTLALPLPSFLLTPRSVAQKQMIHSIPFHKNRQIVAK